ncbi:hypothetical protein Syun_006459 [Stephania yunnanensis]|uniref:Uncharacterized protein n=1 Tax=Stephania yunnanensis TaxID=152371 RepID=A0AAP0PXK6_9MAGN
MVICFEDETGRCWKGNLIGDEQFTLNIRIIDFGSGVDEFTIKQLNINAKLQRRRQKLT